MSRSEGAALPLALVPEPRSRVCSRLADRLLDARYEVVTGPGRPVDLLVTVIEGGATPEDAAASLFDAVELVRRCRRESGALPRRVIALVHGAGPGVAPELEPLARSLTRTLLVYLTAHTIRDDMRINGVVVGDGDEPVVTKSLDVAVALASGLLDGVRGQLFEVGSA